MVPVKEIYFIDWLTDSHSVWVHTWPIVFLFAPANCLSDFAEIVRYVDVMLCTAFSWWKLHSIVTTTGMIFIMQVHGNLAEIYQS